MLQQTFLHTLFHTFDPKRAYNKSLTFAVIFLACIMMIAGSSVITYAIVAHSTTQIDQDPLTPINPDPQGIYSHATRGIPVIYDPLTDASTSQWPTQSSPDAGCSFTNHSYHIKQNTQGHIFYCTLFSTFKDFAFQVQMTILTGQNGGVIFRADTTQQLYYLVSIDVTGHYQLFIHDNTAKQTWNSLQTGHIPSHDFNSGNAHTNTITIITHGSLLYLYINKSYVMRIHDLSLQDGKLGLMADNKNNSHTEVAFQNAKIWSF